MILFYKLIIRDSTHDIVHKHTYYTMQYINANPDKKVRSIVDMKKIIDIFENRKEHYIISIFEGDK